MNATTFNSIYTNNYSKLVNYFSTSCGQSYRPLFEEFVNDGFTAIYTDVNFSFKDIESTLAYIKRLVKNAFIDHLRVENAAYKGKTTKISDFVNENGVEILPIVDTTNKNISLIKESKKEIKQALKQVSPIARKVFVMYYTLGYTNQEISDKLNLSINTVLSHVSRTRKQLKEILN